MADDIKVNSINASRADIQTLNVHRLAGNESDTGDITSLIVTINEFAKVANTLVNNSNRNAKEVSDKSGQVARQVTDNAYKNMEGLITNVVGVLRSVTSDNNAVVTNAINTSNAIADQSNMTTRNMNQTIADMFNYLQSVERTGKEPSVVDILRAMHTTDLFPSRKDREYDKTILGRIGSVFDNTLNGFGRFAGRFSRAVASFDRAVNQFENVFRDVSNGQQAGVVQYSDLLKDTFAYLGISGDVRDSVARSMELIDTSLHEGLINPLMGMGKDAVEVATVMRKVRHEIQGGENGVPINEALSRMISPTAQSKLILRAFDLIKMNNADALISNFGTQNQIREQLDTLQLIAENTGISADTLIKTYKKTFEESAGLRAMGIMNRDQQQIFNMIQPLLQANGLTGMTNLISGMASTGFNPAVFMGQNPEFVKAMNARNISPDFLVEIATIMQTPGMDKQEAANRIMDIAKRLSVSGQQHAAGSAAPEVLAMNRDALLESLLTTGGRAGRVQPNPTTAELLVGLNRSLNDFRENSGIGNLVNIISGLTTAIIDLGESIAGLAAIVGGGKLAKAVLGGKLTKTVLDIGVPNVAKSARDIMMNVESGGLSGDKLEKVLQTYENQYGADAAKLLKDDIAEVQTGKTVANVMGSQKDFVYKLLEARGGPFRATAGKLMYNAPRFPFKLASSVATYPYKIGRKTVSAVVGGSKAIARSAGKSVVKLTPDAIKKFMMKEGGRMASFRASKYLPLIGNLAGAYVTGDYAYHGQYGRAGLAAISTIAGNYPGIGTGAALSIDGYLLYQEMNDAGLIPEGTTFDDFMEVFKEVINPYKEPDTTLEPNVNSILPDSRQRLSGPRLPFGSPDNSSESIRDYLDNINRQTPYGPRRKPLIQDQPTSRNDTPERDIYMEKLDKQISLLEGINEHLGNVGSPITQIAETMKKNDMDPSRRPSALFVTR